MNKYANIPSWSRRGIVGLYLLLCIFYFLPIEAPYKLTYPLTLLTIVSLWGGNPPLTMALLFSAVGDLCGASGALLLQIGAFAVAQICYLWILAHRPIKTSTKSLILAVATPLVLSVFALVSIFPIIEMGAMKVGVIIYALLIGLMATLAGLSKNWCVRIGGGLFMLSDFLLAYSIFVAHNLTLTTVSLVPYFAGQILLWLGLQRAPMEKN